MDKVAGGIAEVGGVSGVVPDGRAAAVIEAAIFGVGLVGVDAAFFAWGHEAAGEGVDMVGCVAEGPVLELDEFGVHVADEDIFIRFGCAGSIGKDRYDLDIACV